MYANDFEISILRVKNGLKLYPVSSETFDFPSTKIGEVHSRNILLAQWDSPPFSHVKNRKLQGLEGRFLNLFCDKYNLTYRIVNKKTELFSMPEYLSLMKNLLTEMCLNTNVIIHSIYFDKISLGKMDGLCIISPRNIISSSYTNAYPFDLTTTLLISLAVMSTIIWWKVLSSMSKSKFSNFFILINIYKCTLGLGVEGENRMSRKEKLLIYSYIVGSMIMVSLYQGILIAVMLTEPSVSSIQSLNELNESTTKINKFFKETEYKDVIFRDKVIHSRINHTSTDMALKVPESFDRNLAYLVTCSYANAFLKSGRNLDENSRRLFDLIPEPILLFPEQYTLSTIFPLWDNFKQTVSSLQESGIRDFWIKELLNDNSNDMKATVFNEEKKTLIDFRNMVIPFAMLLLGSTLGLVVFILEQFIKMIFAWRKRKVFKFKA